MGLHVTLPINLFMFGLFGPKKMFEEWCLNQNHICIYLWYIYIYNFWTLLNEYNSSTCNLSKMNRGIFCQISISSSDRVRSDTSHDLILEHSWCRQEVGWFISQGFSWDVVGCLTCTVYVYIDMCLPATNAKHRSQAIFGPQSTCY